MSVFESDYVKSSVMFYVATKYNFLRFNIEKSGDYGGLVLMGTLQVRP